LSAAVSRFVFSLSWVSIVFLSLRLSGKPEQ
jgi:hypothetical protein